MCSIHGPQISSSSSSCVQPASFVILRFRDTGRRGIDRVERSGVKPGGSD